MIIAGYDCETTGLLNPDHRIIEACVQLWELDIKTFEHERLSSETWRCKPNRRIDPSAQAAHGITSEDLANCPEWEEVAPLICDRLERSIIGIAHNGNSFDWPFLIQELERVALPIPDFEPFDTMLEGRWATPLGKVPNLRELAFACGVQYDDALAHAAEYDVDVMMKAFFNGLKMGAFKLPTL